MKQINLVKYGFIRSEEDDFNDDGNNFKGYRLFGLRFSYLRYNGDVYLSGRADDNRLNYEEYSKLTHYNDLDALNGVNADDITEKDLINLVNNAKAFVEEYKALADELEKTNPTKEVLIAKYNMIIKAREIELDKINSRFKVAILNLYDWELKNFKYYYDRLVSKKNINIEKEVNRIFGTAYSRKFLTDSSELMESWYYKELDTLLKKVGA